MKPDPGFAELDALLRKLRNRPGGQVLSVLSAGSLGVSEKIEPPVTPVRKDLGDSPTKPTESPPNKVLSVLSVGSLGTSDLPPRTESEATARILAYLRRQSPKAATEADILRATRCGPVLGRRAIETLHKERLIAWVGKGTPAQYVVFPKIPSAQSYTKETPSKKNTP
jgi:hypothetical protein